MLHRARQTKHPSHYAASLLSCGRCPAAPAVVKVALRPIVDEIEDLAIREVISKVLVLRSDRIQDQQVSDAHLSKLATSVSYSLPTFFPSLESGGIRTSLVPLSLPGGIFREYAQ